MFVKLFVIGKLKNDVTDYYLFHLRKVALIRSNIGYFLT